MTEPGRVIPLPFLDQSFAKKRRLRNIVVLNPKKQNRIQPVLPPSHGPDAGPSGLTRTACKTAWEGDFERVDLFAQINASTIEILQEFQDSDIEELTLESEVIENVGNLSPMHCTHTIQSDAVLCTEPDTTIEDGAKLNAIMDSNSSVRNDVMSEDRAVRTALPVPQVAWNGEQRKPKRKKTKYKKTEVLPFETEKTGLPVLNQDSAATNKNADETEEIDVTHNIEEADILTVDSDEEKPDCEVYQNTTHSSTERDLEGESKADELSILKTRLLTLRPLQLHQPPNFKKKFDLDAIFKRISLPDRPPLPYASQFPHRMYTLPCPDYRVEMLQSQEQVFTPGELLQKEIIEDGLTPLHLAARQGQLHQIHVLISTGADVNAVDRHGRIPLMLAFNEQHVHMDCVQTLVNDSSFLNQQVTDGATALHMACYLGHYHLVEYLISKGSDPRITDGEGRLPIHWATHPSNPKSIQCIAGRYARMVNATDDANMTPLMWAAFHDQISCVSLLLSLGAEVEEKDIEGKTALHWAVHPGSSKCLRRLLRLEATFFKDHLGKTILHQAAEKGSISSLKAVLAVRSDSVADTDKQGRTPLHWAAVCDQVEACKYLIDRGADSSQTDNNDKTPLDYALMKGHNYTVALFTCHETSVFDLSRSLLQDDSISLLSHAPSRASLFTQGTVSSSSRSLLRSSASARPLPPPSRAYTAIRELEVLAYGCIMGAYEFGMQGGVHRVYMWLDISTARLCWGRDKKSYFNDNYQTSPLKEVSVETSREEREKCLNDLKGQKHFLFKIETLLEIKYVVAFNELSYSAWTDQLAKYLLYSPRSLVGLKRFLI